MVCTINSAYHLMVFVTLTVRHDLYWIGCLGVTSK
jgi:hypothetical protein